MFNTGNEIIDNTKEARDTYGYLWGANYVEFSKEEIEALQNGKCIAFNDGEYVTFISLNFGV